MIHYLNADGDVPCELRNDSSKVPMSSEDIDEVDCPDCIALLNAAAHRQP